MLTFPVPANKFTASSPKLTDHSKQSSDDAADRANTKADRAKAKALEQFYTCPQVAYKLYKSLCAMFDPADFLMVEPSAGTGVFFDLLPHGSLGFDLEPKYSGIQKADFLKTTICGDWKVAVIGNPPFKLAVPFFNHAAQRANVIAMIMPRSVRKASIENRLDRGFHLIHEEIVPDDAFFFLGKRRNVPAVFQIWERRAEPRQLRPIRAVFDQSGS